jgi:aminoglycoside phosphotransferase (APT) family kinase protein
LRKPDQLDNVFVAEIIQAQFPQLAPVRAVRLGEGYDNVAFEVNERWVFRFPKRADVERQLLIETRILPVLAQQAPVPIPVFSFRGQPSSVYPRHFAGYTKLAGVPAIQLDPARVPFLRLAPALARILFFLHSFSVSAAARCGVPEQRIGALIEEIRAEALRDFELVSEIAPDAPLEKWRSCLEAGVDAHPALGGTPALVHNDLAAEHLLLDPATQTVTGIIDWSDVAVSDPAVDFAGVFHWGGEALVNAVLSKYEGHVDELVLRRARFMAACRGVADVAFGLETDRREYIVAGVRALKLCFGT